MSRFDVDEFVGTFCYIITVVFSLMSVCSCLCYSCSCCPLYKRICQGTVYQRVTHTLNRVENTRTNNLLYNPTPQQVNVTPNKVAYPVQQTFYPVQPIGVVPTSLPAYESPSANFEPAMLQPNDQPPQYSEIINMPIASAPTAQDAYENRLTLDKNKN